MKAIVSQGDVNLKRFLHVALDGTVKTNLAEKFGLGNPGGRRVTLDGGGWASSTGEDGLRPGIAQPT